MESTADFIKLHTSPLRIIFFGSITTDHFDDWSDIDVIAIYSSLVEADQARRILYTSRRPDLGHSIEILCVDDSTYRSKSEIGGVYFIAREEGRTYFTLSDSN